LDQASALVKRASVLLALLMAALAGAAPAPAFSPVQTYEGAPSRLDIVGARSALETLVGIEDEAVPADDDGPSGDALAIAVATPVAPLSARDALSPASLGPLPGQAPRAYQARAPPLN